jgi:hypothetical protein
LGPPGVVINDVFTEGSGCYVMTWHPTDGDLPVVDATL